MDRLIKASYALLGLISFLTSGEDECRAWTITNGTKAPQAAGKIHTDFERGFIRAEVVSFDDLMACGSMAAAKEKGLVRSEGKERHRAVPVQRVSPNRRPSCGTRRRRDALCAYKRFGPGQNLGPGRIHSALAELKSGAPAERS